MISRMKQMIGSFSRMLVAVSVMFSSQWDEVELELGMKGTKDPALKVGHTLSLSHTPSGVLSAETGGWSVCVRVEEEAHRQTQKLGFHVCFCSAGSHLLDLPPNE